MTAPTASVSLDAAAPVVRRIHAERVLLLGWGRAILMQLAHPLIAAGVDEHSRFHRERYGGLHRLRRTLDAMLALTFETPEAPRAARRINATHDRVRGTLREATPAFPVGTPYSAHDPDLLRWVHATLLDSFLLTYQRFVAPLTPEEEDIYCFGTHVMESALGAPAGHFPRSRAALDAYLQEMLAGDIIYVTDTARRLSKLILWPDAPLPLRPGGAGQGGVVAFRSASGKHQFVRVAAEERRDPVAGSGKNPAGGASESVHAGRIERPVPGGFCVGFQSCGVHGGRRRVVKVDRFRHVLLS